MAAHSANPASFADLVDSVQRCRLCADQLPMGPRPVLQVDPRARILIAGQAPGRRVHESGVPFADPSGDRLRQWLGVSPEDFYDASKLAILPMGFCFPGTGKSGDLPPRPECAPAWRSALLAHLNAVQVTIVIGAYAQQWHLPKKSKTLTESVAAWRDLAPAIFPLPHPSPRNNIWLKKNPWFAESLLPALKRAVKGALTG